MIVFDSENLENKGQRKMLIIDMEKLKGIFYEPQDRSIHNVIEEVCKEWAKYHEHMMPMPQPELIDALHKLNELTFKIEIP